MSAALRVIITGGTFDKAYDSRKGELTLSRTHLPAILKSVRCTVPVVLEICRLLDSLQMGDEDRFAVRDACSASPERSIVITHGTDTMVETASVIRDAGLDRTIVLTGAMVPYAVTGSDALFNLGSAVSSAQLLPSGVYISMHGRIYESAHVRKNRKRGVFEEVQIERTAHTRPR